MNINKMIRDISDIAVAKGLVGSDWPGQLKVKLRNGRGIPCGGKLGGYPYINICAQVTAGIQHPIKCHR
jgi:hypothetical protein